MGLVELSEGVMTAVSITTFAAEQVLERKHLQAALRDNIALLDPELLVIAEEWGDFEGTNRRIDLLCLDRQGRAVVVELKRTNDGGHMELQALRYAAMVSTMTSDDLKRIFAEHLDKVGDDPGSAGERLGEWLSDVDSEEVPSRDVRIVLVAADFSTEITTTVLWLIELYGLDITCVRLTPYKYGDQVLVDIAQVIPLPEAEELTIKLRRRETAAKSSPGLGKDYTRFKVVTPSGTTDPLAKRRAMLYMVKALAGHGVSPQLISDVLPNTRFLNIEGEHTDPDEIVERFIARWPNATPDNMNRWFVDDPIVVDGRTWLLKNGWGSNTEELLRALADLVPDGSFSIVPVH